MFTVFKKVGNHCSAIALVVWRSAVSVVKFTMHVSKMEVRTFKSYKKPQIDAFSKRSGLGEITVIRLF